MKQTFALLFLSLALLLTVTSFATPVAAASHADIAGHESCQYCGMDREKFAQSRMLIEFDDGSVIATCSLHCTAVSLANNIDKTPKAVKVADYDTKELIDAEKAVWVIGGNKQGVMTKNAKWAFGNKAKAEAFIKEHGGKMAGFEEAIKTAYEDMYTDTKMIRDKRRHMNMKKNGHEMKHDMGHEMKHDMGHDMKH